MSMLYMMFMKHMSCLSLSLLFPCLLALTCIALLALSLSAIYGHQ